MQYEKQASLTHTYRGYVVYLRFYWLKPNDRSPAAVHIVEASEISGFGITAAELESDWPDYQSALAAALAAATRHIDSQLE
ncbi:hypothetical protein [Pseudomonas paraversuta]|uniref:hypothetical protein n=1 Tax=Pseudomonas paraversuta TaxID=2750624 RepID=UPI001933AF7F|nr:hypothetical protein [Pseudomonas paraversuta]